ncbi:hypothetical protein [Caldivirga maquilingensis]|uniref:Uncharacterized protein n=1 Tax=Caldivirga maquilingensis (strain ATCC 700844 / DSM 13496 / JCM 10307 / IC-167) TaxID=397948 RepID=A8MD55_CALMQ|nr:hypothetical protein [Caldivirga maquilingensis]ABW01711.1 hypothetical protein Cmaq_0876 [Caldivirga maquilingensis IC-167]
MSQVDDSKWWVGFFIHHGLLRLLWCLEKVKVMMSKLSPELAERITGLYFRRVLEIRIKY